MDSDLYLGLMSGTSVDGLDIALCEFEPNFRLVAAKCTPFPAELRARILSFSDDLPKQLDSLMRLDSEIAEFAGACINRFLASQNLEASRICAVGFHGQTLRHRPDQRNTLQTGNSALLAELTQIDIISDFRSRDLAAGGQGAPLVPAFHKYLVATQGEALIGFLNLGGIANLTLISDRSTRGFDTGPANILMDYWITKHQGKNYDANGDWAATGQISTSLLADLDHDYFHQIPPKSTGRELFNADWLEQIIAKHAEVSAPDIQRTLLELTAQTITNQLIQFCQPLPDQLYLCGGGAQNRCLIERLASLLPSISMKTTDDLCLHPDWVEAAAFAWLAKRFIEREPGNLPEVTGASGPRILGALYPK